MLTSKSPRWLHLTRLGLVAILAVWGVATATSAQAADTTTTTTGNGIFDSLTTQYVYNPSNGDVVAYDGQGAAVSGVNRSLARTTFLANYAQVMAGTRFNLLTGKSYFIYNDDDAEQPTTYYMSSNGNIVAANGSDNFVETMAEGEVDLTFEKDGNPITFKDSNGDPVANPEKLNFLINSDDSVAEDQRGTANKAVSDDIVQQLSALKVTIDGTTYEAQTTPQISDNVFQDPSSSLKYKAINGRVTATFVPVKATQPVTPSTPVVTSTSQTTSDSSSSSQSQTTTKKPNLNVVLYGLKKLALYRTPDFSTRTKIATYARVARNRRPEFVVTGYAQSKNGTPRYLVRDVNHQAKTYGKTGYITAKRAYVAQAYIQKRPRAVRVIGKHGVTAYRKRNLTKKVTHYRQHQVLKIKGLVHVHRTTRLILTNGHYISGNKVLVASK